MQRIFRKNNTFLIFPLEIFYVRKYRRAQSWEKPLKLIWTEESFYPMTSLLK
jgi:hypothetical protein